MKRWLYGLSVVLLLIVALGFTFYLAPLRVSDAALHWRLWRAGVRSNSVDVDGYRIHYLEAAPPGGQAGKPLLLVHGLGSRSEDWAAMIPTLAAHGFHVYALDLLGYGRSPRPDVDYSIGLEEKTTVDFLHAVGVSHADVGGWSMGGWVALKLAIDHPEVVDRLIVYDAAGVYFPATFDASLFTPHDAVGLRQLQAMLSPAPKALPEFVEQAAVRKLDRNAWVIRRSVASMEGGRDLLDFKLHRIHQPTLIVWGGEDRLIPLSVGETMHRDIAGSSLLVIAGCGHLAPAECPQPVLDGTLHFLEAEPPIQPLQSGAATAAGH